METWILIATELVWLGLLFIELCLYARTGSTSLWRCAGLGLLAMFGLLWTLRVLG